MLLESKTQRGRERRETLSKREGGRVSEAEGGRDRQKRDEDLLYLTDSLG